MAEPESGWDSRSHPTRRLVSRLIAESGAGGVSRERVEPEGLESKVLSFSSSLHIPVSLLIVRVVRSRSFRMSVIEPRGLEPGVQTDDLNCPGVSFSRIS